MKIFEDYSIHAWLVEHEVKTERGYPISFYNHPFLYDMYNDFTPEQAEMKPAQIGATQKSMNKLMFMGDKIGLDAIYTLPTDGDISDMVGGKMNRIIDQNPYFGKLVKDKDSVHQKQIGKSMVHFKGTWNQKTSMMTPADALIHDEIDSSKQDVIAGYESRTQASKFKWRWVFSHPSTEGVGVHKFWLDSDQKYWFVKCRACGFDKFLKFPDSICFERGVYQCRQCHSELTDDDRRGGRWVARYPGKERSGYWISALICPWIGAKEVIKKSQNQPADLFTNRVLGLPFVGLGNKISEEDILQNVQTEPHPKLEDTGKVVIGMDTGKDLHFVVGDPYGLFMCGQASTYEDIDVLMKRWPKCKLVMDGNGDIIAARKFRGKYPNRVFFCYYQKDKKNDELITYGSNKEKLSVRVDRNRMISLLGGEFRDARMPLFGTRELWYPLAEHANNIYRITSENKETKMPEYVWERSGPDHLFHAALYCRVGLDKHIGKGQGTILNEKSEVDPKKVPVLVLPDGKIAGDNDDPLDMLD